MISFSIPSRSNPFSLTRKNNIFSPCQPSFSSGKSFALPSKYPFKVKISADSFSYSEPELSYLKAIQSSEEKIYFLTEHFIRISRLEHGLIQIRKEERDLLKTLRNALGQILDQAEKKEIRFEFELPEKMHVMHDANWLGEAIFNLLDNAVKYSPQNGKIKITLQENEMFTTFSIRDYGIGIEPEEKNLIFQRFYRGKRVTDEEGFGIGLYLAREILFLHEGLLTVKRCEPGVEMKLSLPRQ